MREILVYNKKAKDETSCEICTQQTNKQTNKRRNRARDSCVTNKQTRDEKVRESLAQETMPNLQCGILTLLLTFRLFVFILNTLSKYGLEVLFKNHNLELCCFEGIYFLVLKFFYLLQIKPEPRAHRSKLPLEAEKKDSSKDRFQPAYSTDSEDLLFNFSEDDEMDRINRKALLGTVL